MYYVYALVNKDGRIYVGLTKDLETRVKEHNSGKTKSTKAFIPWRNFYSETVTTLSQARIREKKLKSGCGKEFLEEVLKFAPVAHSDRATAF